MPRNRLSSATPLAVPLRHAPHPQPLDVDSFAGTIAVSPRRVWHLVHTVRQHYLKREIPKKSGGVRTLHVPNEYLGYVQRQILHTYLNPLEYPPWVAAYVPGRSTMQAARPHVKSAVLIVVDLKDFFPSIPRWWVKEALAATLGLPDDVTGVLSTLTTTPDAIPQGAATSGAVANIVALHRLDPGIVRVCEELGMRYTRYADDLAFTRAEDLSRDETHAFIGKIIREIRRAGFAVNYDKIRVQRPHAQQRLLGMCINEKLSYPSRDRRKLRALIHSAATRGSEATALRYGYESPGALEDRLGGLLAYVQGVNPGQAAALRRQWPEGP